jgi:hypothetical protein
MAHPEPTLSKKGVDMRKAILAIGGTIILIAIVSAGIIYQRGYLPVGLNPPTVPGGTVVSQFSGSGSTTTAVFAVHRYWGVAYACTAGEQIALRVSEVDGGEYGSGPGWWNSRIPRTLTCNTNKHTGIVGYPCVGCDSLPDTGHQSHYTMQVIANGTWSLAIVDGVQSDS